MAADTTTTAAGSAKESPADNPTAWFEQKLATKAPDAPTTPAQPAAETPAVAAVTAPPAPTETDWWESGLAEAQHGFLKGRKGPEVENAFRHSERAKQTAERERNELRQQLEQSRAETAARNAALQAEVARRNPQPEQPTADPFAGLDTLMFSDPLEYARRMAAMSEAKAKEFIAEERKRQAEERQQTDAKTTAETRQRELTQQSEAAWKAAGTTLNITPEVWEKRSTAVLVALTDPQGPYYAKGGPLVEANYVEAYRDIFGEAQAAAPALAIVAAPIAVTPATPPGSKKPATTTAPSADATPPISDARRRAAENLAAIGGLDVDKFVDRVARRHGRNNA